VVPVEPGTFEIEPLPGVMSYSVPPLSVTEQLPLPSKVQVASYPLTILPATGPADKKNPALCCRSLNVPLKEALKSPFLAAMRENHDLFKETEGGCALWKNREQVQALLGGRSEAAV